jgi:hypothetical protein
MNSTVNPNIIYNRKGVAVPLEIDPNLGKNIDIRPIEVDKSGKTVYNTQFTLGSDDVSNSQSNSTK